MTPQIAMDKENQVEPEPLNDTLFVKNVDFSSDEYQLRTANFNNVAAQQSNLDDKREIEAERVTPVTASQILDQRKIDEYTKKKIES